MVSHLAWLLPQKDGLNRDFDEAGGEEEAVRKNVASALTATRPAD
jgi:hypothetical protein